MTKDEALKLALEVLEEGVQGTRPLGVATLEAIATIKEALAQPEQEPVAWDNCHAEKMCRSWCGNSLCASHYADTTPPQRTWVGLTDEEVITMSRYDLEYAALIGEVQRRLKEKNNV